MIASASHQPAAYVGFHHCAAERRLGRRVVINAASTNGGTSLAFGVSAANDAKIRAANVAYQVAQQAAQVAKAATKQVAKDTLANTGDVGPR